MIVTVTPNPAVDITYAVPQLHHGAVHRVRQVSDSAGGKGVNVARVLAGFGRRVSCSGFLAGAMGEYLQDLLDHDQVEQAWTLVAGETRRTVTIVEDDGRTGATLFNEPGPTVTGRDWERLTRAVLTSLADAGLLVISGSTPPGTGAGDLPALVRSAVGQDIPVIVDTSGPALLEVAAARPTVVKPNIDEVREATGIEDPIAAARDLITRGAHAVLVSRGSDGVLLVTAHGAWQARPPAPITGNATGAGDAAVAALAMAVADGARGGDLAAHLPDVVALSAAAVLMPTAGAVDHDAYDRMRTSIHTETADAAD
ncbi:1-phosphofructokinase family hexose kinase [Ruania halotolerans]|uniref:1-phosphofructokinase family hexose kinase n=1 Tax=Ruania halotolerans TaxID=2897773 RepID=UPI001E3DD7E8|nr:1-phosphofructokinase family hexose kinase [Ruania halotolerans]UFU05013.1 1-phosphofructokinase family hexose kinase [Ruania halotolerans]